MKYLTVPAVAIMLAGPAHAYALDFNDLAELQDMQDEYELRQLGLDTQSLRMERMQYQYQLDRLLWQMQLDHMRNLNRE